MNVARPKRDITTPKYPDVAVQLTGTDGNVFSLISRCLTAARRAGLPRETVDAFAAECMDAKSYDEALRVMMAWFAVS